MSDLCSLEVESMKFISKNKKVVKSGEGLLPKRVVKHTPVIKEGTFCGTTRGFGFVQVEGEEDIFVPERDTKGALHKDTVQVEVLGSLEAGKRREGKIVKIVKIFLLVEIGK